MTTTTATMDEGTNNSPTIPDLAPKSILGTDSPWKNVGCWRKSPVEECGCRLARRKFSSKDHCQERILVLGGVAVRVLVCSWKLQGAKHIFGDTEGILRQSMMIWTGR